LADTQYVGVDGEGGWFQLHHRVYDRAGERCLTCGRANIVKVAVAGRGTHFCPRCQK
jgi:formamidopyrimidine-DNA glycosylase